ncbi:hypothetical protein C8Q70DRAFT_368573 [Cubamyces menziesii]|nr:hypothetical protein C8Q70DRAFT_368573 [Cubamyces menziesii]
MSVYTQDEAGVMYVCENVTCSREMRGRADDFEERCVVQGGFLTKRDGARPVISSFEQARQHGHPAPSFGAWEIASHGSGNPLNSIFRLRGSGPVAPEVSNWRRTRKRRLESRSMSSVVSAARLVCSKLVHRTYSMA